MILSIFSKKKYNFKIVTNIQTQIETIFECTKFSYEFSFSQQVHSTYFAFFFENFNIQKYLNMQFANALLFIAFAFFQTYENIKTSNENLKFQISNDRKINFSSQSIFFSLFKQAIQIYDFNFLNNSNKTLKNHQSN